MRALISIIIAGSLMGGCSYANKKMNLEDDHPAEELLERVIKNETGVDVDLSPSSKEL